MEKMPYWMKSKVCRTTSRAHKKRDNKENKRKRNSLRPEQQAALLLSTNPPVRVDTVDLLRSDPAKDTDACMRLYRARDYR